MPYRRICRTAACLSDPKPIFRNRTSDAAAAEWMKNLMSLNRPVDEALSLAPLCRTGRPSNFGIGVVSGARWTGDPDCRSGSPRIPWTVGSPDGIPKDNHYAVNATERSAKPFRFLSDGQDDINFTAVIIP